MSADERELSKVNLPLKEANKHILVYFSNSSNRER